MLATMRPVQQHFQQNSNTSSRSASRNSNHSNHGSPSLSPSRPASARMSQANSNRSATNSTAGTNRSGKKTAPSLLANEVEAVKQTKPGLITLSKPLHSTDKKAKKQFNSSSGNEGSGGEGAKTIRSQRKKKAADPIDAIKAGDVDVLSRSAPTMASQDGWDMPTHRAGGGATEVPLNWQQQMVASTPEKKKGKKAAGNNVMAKALSAQPAKDSLTWQQELLGSNKPRGPTFDVFADSKDEATFGTAGERRSAKEAKPKKKGGVGGAGGGGGSDATTAGGNRKRAGSVGDVTKIAFPGYNLPSKPQNISSSQSGHDFAPDHALPSTPKGKFAYAGPNFHNSPSPASLPVPKFLQQKGSGGDMQKSSSSLFAREAMARQASNDGDNSTSSEEWEEDQKKRSIRGVTAPPELQGGANDTSDTGDQRSVTIESLLAKMMRPGTD